MITVEEMAHVVELYIYKRKGARVKIVMPLHPFIFQIHLDMLHYAYNVASDWMKNE